MTASFSLKKIKTKQTLGQKFRMMRGRKKVSLIDAEFDTKIRVKYLEALENGSWNDLPADAYTKGFVLRYANYLQMDGAKALEEYRSERVMFSAHNNDMILPKKSAKEFGFIITPRILIPILASIFVIFIFAIIIYQIYGFAAAPELVVSSPQDNSVIEEESIEIRGVTDQAATVSINNEKVPVSSDGKFIADLKLHKGINVIEIKSKNKAEKEKALTYTVEYKPKTAEVTVENKTN
jgi:cytoskeletal protein RodZ